MIAVFSSIFVAQCHVHWEIFAQNPRIRKGREGVSVKGEKVFSFHIKLFARLCLLISSIWLIFSFFFHQ